MEIVSRMATIESRDNYLYGRGTNLFIISVVLVGVAALLMISRLAARAHIGSRLVYSDHAIVLSVVSNLNYKILIEEWQWEGAWERTDVETQTHVR